jgi:glycosidase
VPGRTLYHLHSLGAAGAPAVNPDVDAREPCGHGLRALTAWLDHVAALGCGGVLLTPIAVSSTHGYDTVDPFRVDQRLGDDDDLDAFVARCHDLDLRVVLDGVFNHVGRAFPRFRDVVEHGRASPSATGWFRLDFDRDDGDGFAYADFEGHRELVALDHRSDEVLEWSVAVARHWLERGVDGWRLDVAYRIPPPFLAELTAGIHRTHADALLFGEMIHGDYAAFVAETGLHSVTQYELHKAMWSALNDANLFELAWALDRHARLVSTFVPVTFAGNHDVTRIGSQLHDPAHLALVLAVLFSVPGVPCVYYGDELGWRGVKTDGAGGDDAMRQPLPVDAPAGDDVLAVHRELVALRRANPWLTTAHVEVVEVANRRMTISVSGDGTSWRVLLDVDGGRLASSGARFERPGVAIVDG